MNKGIYDDLLNYKYNGSTKEDKMSNEDRAVQFSPFAALTGFETMIYESAEETNERANLSEDRYDKINACLSKIMEHFPERTAVEIVYYFPNEKKEGGAYKIVRGKVRWIDEDAMTLIFSDNSTVQIYNIYDIEIIGDLD